MMSFLIAMIWLLGIGTLIPLVIFWRKKVVRYALLVIEILLFGRIGLIEIRNRNYLKTNELRLTGVYQADTLLKGQDQTTRIKILLKNDNKFEMSRPGLIFEDSVGTWRYFDDGDVACLELDIDNSTEMVFETDQGDIVVKGVRFHRVK